MSIGSIELLRLSILLLCIFTGTQFFVA